MNRKWIILLASVAVLATGVFIYLKLRGSKDFEPLIKEKLQQVVKEGSDSLYILNIGNIDVDVVNSQIVVKDATLDIDSIRLKELDAIQQAPNDVYKISLQNLVIDGINVDDLLNKDAVDLSILYIKEPVVEIYHHKRAYNYTPPDTVSLYKKIAQQVGHLSLKNLWLTNVDFRYYNVANENELTQFKNLNINFKDILVDSTTQDDSTRFLYAKDALITLKDYSLVTSDSLYNFHIDSFALNAGSGNLALTNISLRPRGEKNDFSKKLQFYKDRYDIKIEQASIQKIDWWKLLSEEGFSAEQILLEKGSIEVFADRTLPDQGKNKVGNYPHQLLTRLELPVMIQKISVNDVDVTYTELNNKTGKQGSIVFGSVDGTFLNVTNMESAIIANNYLTLDANAQLMNKGPLHALFKFDLANAKKGTFSLDIEIGKMNGTDFNTATRNLGLFEIKSADIDKIAVHMTAGDNSSSGTVAFFYDNLKVEVLKQKKDENGQMKKQGFISFIANSFIIEKSNKAGDKNKDPKRVYYKRDPQKSFFNLIWKTIFTGLSDTIKGKND